MRQNACSCVLAVHDHGQADIEHAIIQRYIEYRVWLLSAYGFVCQLHTVRAEGVTQLPRIGPGATLSDGPMDDEVMQDMLPRAFSHMRRTHGYIDPKGGWLVVDSASARKTEDFVALLRQALGSLPVVPLATRERPGVVMTQWVSGGDMPSTVTLESECELRSPEEDGGIVRCRRHDLEVPEIQNHIEAGKEVIKLAFTWNDRLSLVLDETLAVKRLRFLDLVQEAAAEVETNEAAERFDIDFSIMSLELAAFLPALAGMFGGENLSPQ